MGRTRDVSKILTANTSLLSLASASATYAPIAAGGLVQIKPSSVVNGTDNGRGSISFTGVTSVSLNDVFSSTYNSYRIIYRIIGNTGTSTDITMRLRVSGADNNASSYQKQQFGANSTTLSGTRTGNSTSWDLAGAITSSKTLFHTMELYNPFASLPTAGFFIDAYNFESNTNIQALVDSLGHSASSSFTGFSLLATQQINGEISVYGFRN